MANPTRAEIQTQIGNAVKIFEEFRKFAGTASPNYIGLEDTLVQSLETDFNDRWGSGIGAFRSALAGAIVQSSEFFTPGFLDYGKFIQAPEVDAQSILTRLYDDFITNTLRVTSRSFTFGTPTFAAPIGNGVINRLNKDENNFDIEAQTPDAKIAQCVQDEHSGSVEHEEVFEFRGAAAERDLLKVTGSGKTKLIKCVSGRDSTAFINNPSFSQFGGTLAAPTSITDWVASLIADFQVSEAVFYRDFLGDTTPRSVLFETNASLKQNFNLRRSVFNPFVPVYVQVALNRNGTGTDGTFTLTFGNVSEAVVLTTLPASGWYVHRLALGTKPWMKNWNKEDPEIKLEITGRTTGTLHVDDVIVSPFVDFDGAWYMPVGGNTPFLRLDKATWTDTATESILQRWFWLAFGRYLPHTTGGGVTWVEP